MITELVSSSVSLAKMQAREIIWYVTFVGFAINYMHRIHINIIIVGMVKSVARESNISISSECIHSSHTIQNVTANASRQIISEDRFNWDEHEQNVILGSFYWIHWLTQIPGGMLARRFGTKLVFGLANFIPSLLTFTLPFAAHFDYRLLVFTRIVQGFIMGLAWPSMHQLTAHWIPPNERSKFVSSYLGSSFGVALTYILCGYVMDMFGWPAAYYTTGVIATIWYICWCVFVYDTPAKHPWISKKEREYIESSLGHTLNEKKIPIPWKSILLSRPLWMVSIVQIGNVWGFYTLLTQAPTYFKNILGLNIRMTGVLTGIPHIFRTLFAIGSGITADFLLRHNILSRTNVRKLSSSCCTLVQGVMVLGLALSGCNYIAAVVFVIIGTGVTGAVSSGPLACIVDLSPNFASICLGIAGLIGNLPGFISPIVVGYLTYQNQTAAQWQKVFMVTTTLLCVTGILYLIYGDANVQPWNFDPHATPQQLEPLNAVKSDGKPEEASLNHSVNSNSGPGHLQNGKSDDDKVAVIKLLETKE